MRFALKDRHCGLGVAVGNNSAASEPLDSSIEKGFFTPTEILLDGGCDPLANGDALCDAVNRDEPKNAFLRIRSIC